MAGFDNMVKRSDKIPFAKKVDAEGDYKRFHGLTEFAESKNPVEYSRRYIDEETERTDVTGYAPEISFDFDEYSDNSVQADIVEIFDKELTGYATHISVLIVNLSKESKTPGSYEAAVREFAVIPDSSGGEVDRSNYSGSLKACGATVFGTATTTDGWETAKFTENE